MKTKISDIPKDKFEKVYLEKSIIQTAKILGISKSGVSRLAIIYGLSKINVLR